MSPLFFGITETGVLHTDADPPLDLESKFQLVKQAGVFDYLDKTRRSIRWANIAGSATNTPLLQFLRAHAVRPQFTCRFRWREGSLAIWDNRGTLHYATDDYAGQSRRMHRLTIEAEEAPF